MLIVETIAKIQRLYHRDHKGFKTIARELKISKTTVKKIIREDKTTQSYQRRQAYPVLEAFRGRLIARLEADRKEPVHYRRTARKLYQELCQEGFTGAYTTVNAYVQKWKSQERLNTSKKAFVPQEYGPGEAFQFDWSEEEIELGGHWTKIKVAHIHLCYSGLFFMVAYRAEALEMVMDAHDKAFWFFAGVCAKGIYDNMKTVVQKVLMGKDREFNRRFLELACHHLFEPIACTPAAGWEKGGVERQVRTARDNFFSPRARVNSLEILNKQLSAFCLEWAKTTRHAHVKTQTIWEMYQEEKPHLAAYRRPFEACKLQPVVVTSTCLVAYETNRYSVDCECVHEAVLIKVYADKLVMVFGERVIGEHPRCFEKHKTLYNVLHYLPVLAYKPGALRNGAPFKQWKMPPALAGIQKQLAEHSDGTKQFIHILLQIRPYGLSKVEAACSQALRQGTHSAKFVLDALTVRPSPSSKASLYPPLTQIPTGDCSGYNQRLLTQGGQIHVA